MYILQLLINGLLLGSVYALIGLGMTITFGIVRLTNLSHGEFIIAGAYASALISSASGGNPVFTLLITVPVMFFLGYFLQSFMISRAMYKGDEPALLVTFSISVILKDVMLLLLSADAQHVSASYSTKTLHIGRLDIPALNLVLFGISLATVAALTFFLNYTYTGKAVRAVADDRDTASLSGINVRHIYAVSFGVSLATAAVAGLCVGMKWTFYPSSGGEYLLIAFIIVVIGGMGSIPGTLLAGLCFGMAQVAGGANYGLLISYIFMLLTLAFRPGKTFRQ